MDVLGSVQPTRLVGYVRNVVPEAPDDYPWPSPCAHFAVWHCRLPEDVEPAGVWLDAASAGTEMGARHWWPLAAHVPPFERENSRAAGTPDPGRTGEIRVRRSR